jgi:hypothetical protein
VLLDSLVDAALTFSGRSTGVEPNGQVAATGRANMLSMANVTVRRVKPFIVVSDAGLWQRCTRTMYDIKDLEVERSRDEVCEDRSSVWTTKHHPPTGMTTLKYTTSHFSESTAPPIFLGSCHTFRPYKQLTPSSVSFLTSHVQL